jgi:hypothetical protein
VSDIDHDHDDEGNCVPQQNGFYNVSEPDWRFSLWDVAAVGVSVVGAICGSIGNIGIVINQGTNMLAREFGAAANYQRQTFDLKEAHRLNEEARAKMAEGLRELTGWGDES